MKTTTRTPPPAVIDRGTAVVSLRDAITQLDPTATFHPWIWVQGEISDVRKAQSGHTYLVLSSADAEIPCVLWKHVARGIPITPYDGLQVWINGWIQPHPKRRSPELDVRDIILQSSQGPRRRATDQLQARLAAEGLLDPGRKRPLPEHIASIGVVTSPSGDVIHDVRRVLQRRAPQVRVELGPTRVSGEGAALEIAEAVRTVGRTGAVNAVIVTRGGGSAADLAAFNTEAVARAIAESPIPVISAIGHEPDTTLADLVADVCCATPTEAAEQVAGRAATAAAERSLASARTAEFTFQSAGARFTVRVEPAADSSWADDLLTALGSPLVPARRTRAHLLG